jgi:large subunit ribosomal protein L4
MAKIAVHNLKGEKVEEIEISDTIFALPANNDLLHQVFVAMSANKRFSIAHTKDKSERSGSGKKPFRQKGTGNARQGQKRNPVMKGGGIAFGPTSDRNFSKDVNKKMKQKAVKIALSEKVRSEMLIVLDEFSFTEKKTKFFATALSDMKIKGSALVSFDSSEREIEKISRNIPAAQNILTKDLNVLDMLNNKYLILSKQSIAFLEEKFQEKK